MGWPARDKITADGHSAACQTINTKEVIPMGNKTHRTGRIDLFITMTITIAICIAAILINTELIIHSTKQHADTETRTTITLPENEIPKRTKQVILAVARTPGTGAKHTYAHISTIEITQPQQETDKIATYAGQEPELSTEPVEIPLPANLQTVLKNAADEFDIKYAVALAVIEQETNFNNLIGDGGNSFGYFQIQPRWWMDYLSQFGITDLSNDAQNLRAGCAVIRNLIDRYGSLEAGLKMYNPGFVDVYGRNYAQSILAKATKWENAIFAG